MSGESWLAIKDFQPFYLPSSYYCYIAVLPGGLYGPFINPFLLWLADSVGQSKIRL